jgi:hypothetical protein
MAASAAAGKRGKGAGPTKECVEAWLAAAAAAPFTPSKGEGYEFVYHAASRGLLPATLKGGGAAAQSSSSSSSSGASSSSSAGEGGSAPAVNMAELQAKKDAVASSLLEEAAATKAGKKKKRERASTGAAAAGGVGGGEAEPAPSGTSARKSSRLIEAEAPP